MSKAFIENEVLLRDCPSQVSSSQSQHSSKLHQCALRWSDKCAHCEIGYDELKQTSMLTAEPCEENLKQLRMQIEESLAKLEGFFAYSF